MAIVTVPIPLFNEPYRNVDQSAVNDKSWKLIDGYTDENGFTNRRPGLDRKVDLGTGTSYPVNGMIHWPHQDCVIVASNGKTYKVTYTFGSYTVTDLTGDTLQPNTPVVSCIGWNASFSTRAFLANGGRIIFTDGTANTAYIADGDAPTTVTHIAFMDGYLFAINGTNKFFWCDVNDYTTWTATSFASTAGNADLINALYVYNGEIFLFGTQTVEIWENDGTNPFSRKAGGLLQLGCAAPYSPVVTDKAIYWLSNRRKFIGYSGGKLVEISTPYDKELSSYSTVADCSGSWASIGGKDFLIWTFPSENKTLAFCVNTEKWAEWGYWDNDNAEYQRWLGNCYVWVPTWGLHLVGGRTNPYIYEMSSTNYTDDGQMIRTSRLTGHISYGSLKTKRSNQIRIRARRGEAGTTVEPAMTLRMNDDNRGWGRDYPLSLGSPGDTSLVLDLQRTGIYSTRQYEITITDNVPVVYGEAEEDLEVLR